MKELIDKLSLGVIDYLRPIIEVSINQLELKMEAKKTHSGSFRIVSTNEKELKGIVFSTDNRVVIENNQFIGRENTIHYKINTDYTEQGEDIKGFINIVSNGGEVAIPYCICVDSVSAETTTGNVKNLFHFANLVQMSYDEALKLFSSPYFSHIFLQNDLQLLAVYNGLIGSKDANLAMEEFLVAANKKNSVKVTISKENQEYSDLKEDFGDTIVVSKDTWGYVNIKVQVTGDFIGVDKRLLTSNDFAGSNYELFYCIKKDKLHRGNNYGRIRFIYDNKIIDFTVLVSMKGEKYETLIDYKSALITVTKKYLDFRMHKITLSQWAEDSDTAISRVRSAKDSMFMKLLQAHIYITKGRESDGAWLLENVAEDLIPNREIEIELYCYYLYVRTIQKRDDEFTSEIIKKVRGYYEAGNDSWKLLWILLYLDPIYENNISMKVLRIKEQFLNGMRSPLLYFEALSSFEKVPEILRVMDEFEIQVLNFGVKNDFINRRLAMQINDITCTERRFNQSILNILIYLYEKYPEDDILENICSLLIKGNKTDPVYFKWFEKGVEKGLKITTLYEYYMYTINDDYKGIIPQIVMMYFMYNSTTLPDEKIDLLYANIVYNKEKIQNIYNGYKLQLEKYTADSIMEGRMNRNLAIIYKDILTKAMVGPEMAERIPDVLNTYEIFCEDENMENVLIIHKEINRVDRYHLKNGRANVRIYTEDEAIIFEDLYGNRYNKSVKYTKTKLLDMEEYLKMCYEISTGNKSLALYFCDRYLKYRKNPEKSISILKYILQMDEIIRPYHLMVEKEIVDYYFTNYDGDSLDEYLLTATAENLGAQARVKIVEMTIIRGLYKRTYQLVSQFGFKMIDPRRVLKCASKLIEEDGAKEDQIILYMAAFAFERGKYNEVTLNYLSRYYNGTTKELLAIWKAASDFQCEERELEERIVVQMLFSGAYVGKIQGIYDSYFKKGVNTKVKKAYLFSKAYDYFVREQVIEESIFKYIEKDVYNGDEINDICALAFLKYMSNKDYIENESSEICRNLIYELTRINKVFDFFKKYKKHFKLPYSISDKTVVEYRTNPKKRVFIHYVLEDSQFNENPYYVAEMTDICYGVFTYSFVLFYGENVQYYITEEWEDEVTVTESRNLTIDQVEFSNDSTHYGIINDMLVCREMHEEKTFEAMAQDYLGKKKLMDTIFTIV